MSSGNKEQLISKNFVFDEDEDGRMRFVGDFDGLYAAEADPWGQSGADDRLGDYYAYSRRNIIATLASLPLPAAPAILEIGSGLGYFTDMLQAANSGYKVTGMDISAVAVRQARERFPHLQFVVADAASPALQAKGDYDVVIVNQILWYVLESLEELCANAGKLLRSDGFLAIVQAYPEDQRYGRDIVHGFDGLVNFAADKLLGKRFKMVRAQMDCAKNFLHRDGILVLRKN